MNEIVIALAKASILVALELPESFDLEKALEQYPKLKEDGASFVTITKGSNQELRGCIGSLQAHRPLYKDIIFNAQSSALRDSRFKPLNKKELNSIKIEVSILSIPKIVSYTNSSDLKAKIEPIQDGIVLKLGNNQATYLPQVWEKLPKFDDFFSTLCQKAGLKSTCLLEHPKIMTYQVRKYKEK
ncbi:MAG TPA: AmmeMemoRadiSam system protein A [Campylobacterales bacterium]|nr:AmmeMemoRadiSam system protein A [Campylobacterales bacterium]